MWGGRGVSLDICGVPTVCVSSHGPSKVMVFGISGGATNCVLGQPSHPHVFDWASWPSFECA